MTYSPISLATQTSADPFESAVRAELASVTFKANLRAQRAKEEMAVEAVKLGAKPEGMGRRLDTRA